MPTSPVQSPSALTLLGERRGIKRETERDGDGGYSGRFTERADARAVRINTRLDGTRAAPRRYVQILHYMTRRFSGMPRGPSSVTARKPSSLRSECCPHHPITPSRRAGHRYGPDPVRSRMKPKSQATIVGRRLDPRDPRVGVANHSRTETGREKKSRRNVSVLGAGLHAFTGILRSLIRSDTLLVRLELDERESLGLISALDCTTHYE